MKAILLGFSLCFASLGLFSTKARANVLVQWNFNFPLAATNDQSDDSVLTGTNVPCIGSGTLSLIGGVQFGASGYDSGSPNCPPCDPFYLTTGNNPKTGPNTNNSAIMVTNFPAVNVGNRSAGFEVSFSTLGYTNISISWEQRESQRASRYHRLQYSIDGVNFVNVPAEQGGVISITAQNIFFPQTNNLSAITNALENNPNVKLRLVAEFESTAISGGTQGDNYVGAVDGTAARYLSTAEVRVDMLTIWGNSAGEITDSFPTITLDSSNVTTIASAPVTNTFTIADAETSVDSLIVSAVSGDTNLVRDANVELLDTTGSSRRVKITATPTCLTPGGTANISLKVTDGGGQFTTAVFAVEIQSGSPVVPNLGDIGTLMNLAATNAFTIVDLDTPALDLMVNYNNSSVTNLLSNENILSEGTTSNRTLVLTPRPDALGGSIVSIGVTDGNCADTNSFLFMVVPRSDVIFYDSFDNYSDGGLTTEVGGGIWVNHNDTAGGIRVVSHALRLNPANPDEYIKAPVLGRGSYLDTNSVPIYARMKFTLLSLPSLPAPTSNTQIGNFLGAGATPGQRARFFASNDGAEPGFYRLGISSTANVPTAYLATNLSPNVTYTVVISFNPTNGIARLWVDPASESDPLVEATDAATNDVAFFAFRQRAAAADALIDDLVVATSFEGALLLPASPVIEAKTLNGNVQLSWAIDNSAGFNLFSNSDLNSTNWQLVAQTPDSQNGRSIVTITNASGNNFYRLQK